MPAERKASVRCAIYTRKSSEEGLEQSFNSLDAQREACHSYIESQRHEGWRPLGNKYDDGGYSGGTTERPALKRLLEDIDAGKIDTVLVYKVDRLTRSLSDFAKIIERFDARKVSFVSVTQQFNTTSSMGRLTLNVLLSFAQFEREVTGERIRDKIAASKRKGMWMGGTVPLGYDLKDRKLVVNAKEADRVREIYHRYLQLGCVSKLKGDLDRRCITSKIRTSGAGRKSGGGGYSRGSLYELLQNRIYVGEVRHKDQSYAGEHEGIVPRNLWERVQARLKANNQARRNGIKASAPSLLAGLIYDHQGNRFTPSHAVKNGKRYRYYISQAVIQNRPGASGPHRIPAHEIENLISCRLQSFLGSEKEVVDAIEFQLESALATQALIAAALTLSKTWKKLSPAEAHGFLRAVISRVVIHDGCIEILVRKSAMRELLLGKVGGSLPAVHSSVPEDFLTLSIKTHLKRCGGEVRLALPAGSAADVPGRAAPSLIKAIARGHQWYDRLINGEVKCQRSIAKLTGLDERYVSRIFQCAFLAPDIVEAILQARQPPEATLDKILARLPAEWREQRRVISRDRHFFDSKSQVRGNVRRSSWPTSSQERHAAG